MLSDMELRSVIANFVSDVGSGFTANVVFFSVLHQIHWLCLCLNCCACISTLKVPEYHLASGALAF